MIRIAALFASGALALDSEWPGEHVVALVNGTIVKTYHGYSHPQLPISHAYKNEKHILKALAEHKHLCDAGVSHFPELLDSHDKDMRIQMTYNGKVVRQGHDTTFRDKDDYCIKNITKDQFMSQVDCMLTIMKAAGVRHLDIYCPGGCNMVPPECGETNFLKNMVYLPDGTVSLIDFEYATLNNEPKVFDGLMCYKRKQTWSDDDYFSMMRANLFEKIAWPTMQTHICGSTMKVSRSGKILSGGDGNGEDSAAHKKHGKKNLRQAHAHAHSHGHK